MNLGVSNTVNRLREKKGKLWTLMLNMKKLLNYYMFNILMNQMPRKQFSYRISNKEMEFVAFGN